MTPPFSIIEKLNSDSKSHNFVISFKSILKERARGRSTINSESKLKNSLVVSHN